ncbi:FG-GAP repeat protein [Streptomyces sp. NPDC000594]|uniref:FG-GAP repeat protein n=1 Tax=Streptomyces sp. NPDC000594 TaxID=3154261 RepID=UPI003328E0B4
MYRRKNLRLTLASATATALMGGLLGLSTGPALAAPARPAAAADDFDGDGFRDYAVPDHEGFTVVYGTAKGPGTRKKTITQKSPGIPGSRGDAGGYADSFGEELAKGDFNRDGYGDLAVGAPNEKVGKEKSAGGVHVLRGGKKGLTGTGSWWFTRATAGVPGEAREYTGFAMFVTLRDIDRDGDADLAVGEGWPTSVLLPAGKGGIGTAGALELPMSAQFGE